MKITSDVVEAVEECRQGRGVIVLAAAGGAQRWQLVRGDLVIDKPPANVYNQKTADAGVEGTEPAGP